jgi:hypothetical protein
MVRLSLVDLESISNNVAEIAGTGGAFASSSAISRWGDNKSFFLTPSTSFYLSFWLREMLYNRVLTVFFAFAGAIWMFISTLSFARPGVVNEEMMAAGLAVADDSTEPTTNYFVMVGRAFRSFSDSVWIGAKLIFTNRCFICECYSISPVACRGANLIARRLGLVPS